MCIHLEHPMKDVGMRIRLEPELRKAFVHKCRLHNTCAAQVLREFMRSYVHDVNLTEDGYQPAPTATDKKL